MNFVMKKSEARIADRHYLMDIPAGALVVAPDTFFARFGKSFSMPDRTTLATDLDKNQVYHAVPSDKKRDNITSFVVRRIHNSRIKDALAGKMAAEILNPTGYAEKLFKDLSDVKKHKEDTKPPVPAINIFALTLPQLKEAAIAHGIDIKKKTREQLTKELQVKYKKEDAEN